MLRVLTLNVAQLGWPLGIKNRQTRVLKLAKVLREELPDFDVLCFQELYRKRAKETLILWLKEEYPYYIVDTSPGRYWIGTNSGLAFFSKIPIAEVYKYVYKHFRGVENFSRKSLWGLKLHYANEPEEKIYVFTTHIQSGIGSEPCICKIFDYFSKSPGKNMTSKELKEAQIDELCKAVQEFAGDNSKVILSGDFNIRATSSLYKKLSQSMNNIGLFDTFEEEKSPIDTTVVGEENKRIDYIWCDTEGESIVATIFGEEGISDHYGVVGKIDVNN